MSTDLVVALRLDTSNWEEQLQVAEQKAENFIGNMQNLPQFDLSSLVTTPDNLIINLDEVVPQIENLHNLIQEIQDDKRLTHLRTDIQNISLNFSNSSVRKYGVTQLQEETITPDLQKVLGKQTVNIDKINLNLETAKLNEINDQLQEALHTNINISADFAENIAAKVSEISIPTDTFIERFGDSVDKLQETIASRGDGQGTLRELADNIRDLKESTMRLVAELEF